MTCDGSIQKRKEGLFELRYIIGHKPDVKPRNKLFYGNSKGKVRKKCDNFIKEENEKRIKPMKISVSNWAARWAETYKKGIVSDSTFNQHICLR